MTFHCVRSVYNTFITARKHLLNTNTSGVFYLCNSELLIDAVGVKKISPKHKRVFGGVDRMDPSGGDEEGVSFSEGDTSTALDCVPEENIPLFPWQNPLLVQGDVVFSRRNQPKHLCNPVLGYATAIVLKIYLWELFVNMWHLGLHTWLTWFSHNGFEKTKFWNIWQLSQVQDIL